MSKECKNTGASFFFFYFNRTLFFLIYFFFVFEEILLCSSCEFFFISSILSSAPRNLHFIIYIILKIRYCANFYFHLHYVNKYRYRFFIKLDDNLINFEIMINGNFHNFFLQLLCSNFQVIFFFILFRIFYQTNFDTCYKFDVWLK